MNQEIWEGEQIIQTNFLLNKLISFFSHCPRKKKKKKNYLNYSLFIKMCQSTCST